MKLAEMYTLTYRWTNTASPSVYSPGGSPEKGYFEEEEAMNYISILLDIEGWQCSVEKNMLITKQIFLSQLNILNARTGNEGT